MSYLLQNSRLYLMKIWHRLFTKEHTVTDLKEQDIMSAVCTVLTKSDGSLLQILNDHKMALLDKDVDYIINSVCGSTNSGPFTRLQTEINHKVTPVIKEMYDLLKIGNLSHGQQEAILFIIRFMLALKILFLMELFKNAKNQQEFRQNDIRDRLEKMETIGRA